MEADLAESLCCRHTNTFMGFTLQNTSVWTSDSVSQPSFKTSWLKLWCGIHLLRVLNGSNWSRIFVVFNIIQKKRYFMCLFFQIGILRKTWWQRHFSWCVLFSSLLILLDSCEDDAGDGLEVIHWDLSDVSPSSCEGYSATMFPDLSNCYICVRHSEQTKTRSVLNKSLLFACFLLSL